MLTNGYLPVDQRSDEHPFQDEDIGVRDPDKLRTWWQYTRCCCGNMKAAPLLLIIFLTVSNIITLISWRVSTTINHSSPSFKSTLEKDISRNDIPKVQVLGPADIPVELEMREFFTGITEDRKTAFIGPPNNETNAAWASIQDGRSR
jgi:hypothetical protein